MISPYSHSGASLIPPTALLHRHACTALSKHLPLGSFTMRSWFGVGGTMKMQTASGALSPTGPHWPLLESTPSASGAWMPCGEYLD